MSPSLTLLRTSSASEYRIFESFRTSRIYRGEFETFLVIWFTVISNIPLYEVVLSHLGRILFPPLIAGFYSVHTLFLFEIVSCHFGQTLCPLPNLSLLYLSHSLLTCQLPLNGVRRVPETVI